MEVFEGGNKTDYMNNIFLRIFVKPDNMKRKK